MKKFKVIYPFRDLQDTGKSFPDGRKYSVGDDYPATKRKVSDERIAELEGNDNKIGKPLIEDVEETKETVEKEKAVNEEEGD